MTDRELYKIGVEDRKSLAEQLAETTLERNNLTADNAALRKALEPVVRERKAIMAEDPTYSEWGSKVEFYIRLTKAELEAAKGAGDE